MNKKFILACLAMCIAPLAGCSSDEEKKSSTSSTTSEVVVNKYTITWKDDDGSVIRTDTNVVEGTMPSAPSDPTKADNAQYHYTFNGWSPTVVAATADAVYTATYSSEVRKYTVTWLNYNGDELEVDTDVPYGTTPSYDGEDPKKESSETTNYIWNKWDKEVASVTGNVTYTAKFDESVRKYHVVFEDYDGTELASGDYEYNAVIDTSSISPSRLDTTDTAYNWIGWDDEVEPVTEEKTYTAVYESTHLDFELVTDHYEVRGILSGDYEGAIHIPATWKGKNVTKVQSNAFYNNKKITAVTFDEGLEYIGMYAFYNVQMESLVIPASVTTIDEGAFTGCPKLSSLTLKEGLSIIRQYAFYGSALQELTIPASVGIVGLNAFGSSYELVKVTFNRATTFADYDSNAFKNSSSITEFVFPNYNTEAPYSYASSISYPLVILKKGFNLDYAGTFERVAPNKDTNEVGKIYYTMKGETDKYLVGAYGDSGSKKVLHTSGAKYIKNSAFYNTEYQLNEVYISADIERIGNYAFCKQEAMTVLEFEASDVKLDFGSSAFRSCTGLTEVDMSERKIVDMIEYTFSFCEKLKSVELSDELITMSNRVFINTVLEEFHVPKKLKNFDGNCINNVFTIKKFTVDPENTYFKAVDDNLFSADEKTMRFYATAKTGTSFNIPSGVETIGHLCFQDCALETISIPKSVTYISEWGFFRMTNVTSVTYAGTLEEFTAVGKHSQWARGMRTAKVTGVTCSDSLEFAFPDVY